MHRDTHYEQAQSVARALLPLTTQWRKFCPLLHMPIEPDTSVTERSEKRFMSQFKSWPPGTNSVRQQQYQPALSNLESLVQTLRSIFSIFWQMKGHCLSSASQEKATLVFKYSRHLSQRGQLLLSPQRLPIMSSQVFPGMILLLCAKSLR